MFGSTHRSRLIQIERNRVAILWEQRVLLGAEGRGLESLRPDQQINYLARSRIHSNIPTVKRQRTSVNHTFCIVPSGSWYTFLAREEV